MGEMDKKITIVGQGNSLFNQYLSELRSVEVQNDRMRFRKNLLRCSQIMAYEMSKHMDYQAQEVETPLGSLEMSLLAEQPVLVSILRAGLPMHNGFLDFFDNADNGFISAFRQHTRGDEFVVKVEYLALPSLADRSLVIIDPMLASGRSMVVAYQAMIPAHGEPSKVFIASLIASEEGVQYVRRSLPNAHLFVGAVDFELTAKAYIVPGLGDAGDLAFGDKTSG